MMNASLAVEEHPHQKKGTRGSDTRPLKRTNLRDAVPHLSLTLVVGPRPGSSPEINRPIFLYPLSLALKGGQDDHNKAEKDFPLL